MKILRKLIEGNPFVSEEISGVFPYCLSETVLQGWEDASSILGWDKYGHYVIDYYGQRIQVMLLVSDFSTLTTEEKWVVAKYCKVTIPEILTFYMQQGMTQQEALELYLSNRAIDFRYICESCKSRSESLDVSLVIFKSLTIESAEQFLTETRLLSFDYITYGTIGTQYGDGRDGLMDYIEGTGGYVDAGLALLTLQEGVTIAQVRSELKNILYYGYRKY